MTISVTYVCDRCGKKAIVGASLSGVYLWPDGWNAEMHHLLCPACAKDAA